MAALSDTLLNFGCAAHIEIIHGESVEILDGPNAGRFFTGVREVESDQVLLTDLGPDARAKIMLHFRDDPQIGMTGKVRTSDGKEWNAIRRPEGAFLTNDYELTEITDKDS